MIIAVNSIIYLLIFHIYQQKGRIFQEINSVIFFFIFPQYIITKNQQFKKTQQPKMTKQSNQSILVPAKFISLILHLLVVTMAYFSFHDNILTAYPNITVKTDPLYIGGRVSFLACNTISLIFLFVEIVILFVGTNMFRERMNFISSSLHFLGAILWSSYIFQQWQFSQIWAIWFICSFLPFCMEIVTVFSVVNK